MEPVILRPGVGDNRPTATLYYGQDTRETLRLLPEASVHTVCTSPPYFGLRDYGTGSWEGGDAECEHKVRTDSRIESSTLGGGKKTVGHSKEGFRTVCRRCGAIRVDNQIGLEATPEDFVAALVDVFREVKRVLRPDGTLWLNLGDSYAGGNTGGNWREGSARADGVLKADSNTRRNRNGNGPVSGLKSKDLIGIPWRVAFALQEDGWYLRQDIIWAKPNPMPESVTDRCTKAHEYVFLFAHPDSGGRYFYDAEAVREQAVQAGRERNDRIGGEKYVEGVKHSDGSVFTGSETRNKRSVWTVNPKPYKGAHFATWPPELVRPMVLAGSPVGGTVLDPFSGSATTGMVALQEGRNYLGIDLNPDYLPMAEARVREEPAPSKVETQDDGDAFDLFADG